METKTKNTVIKSCTCRHDYQDEVYGKGKRVMNRTSLKKVSTPRARCTVCQAVHFI